MHPHRLATALPAGALALALAAGPAVAWPGHGHGDHGAWHGGHGERGSAAAPRAEARAPGTVSVTGHGESTAAPDMAVVTLGVTVQAPSAAEAMRQNAQRQQFVVETLRGRGIEPRDIQTSGLNLSPVQDYSREGRPPVVTGYQATNMVTVRVRDLPRLGEALDALVAAGANEINGIGFQREDLEAAEGEARARAVENARTRAEVMARAAGMELGRLVAISDVAVQQGPQPMMRAMAQDAAAASVPIEAGELAVAADVTLTWELRPARGEDRPGRRQRRGMDEGAEQPGMGHHGMEGAMHHHGGMQGGMAMPSGPGAGRGAAMPGGMPSAGAAPEDEGAAMPGRAITPPAVPTPAVPPASMPPSDAASPTPATDPEAAPAAAEAAPQGGLPAPASD